MEYGNGRVQRILQNFSNKCWRILRVSAQPLTVIKKNILTIIISIIVMLSFSVIAFGGDLNEYYLKDYDGYWKPWKRKAESHIINHKYPNPIFNIKDVTPRPCLRKWDKAIYNA